MVALNRTKDKPWHLEAPPGTSEYTVHVEEKDGARVLVCTVGKTVFSTTPNELEHEAKGKRIRAL